MLSARNLQERLFSSLTGYSNIFFMSNPWAGGIILLATFQRPSIGIHGLASELLSVVYWRWIQSKKGVTTVPPRFNAILCGAFLGYWMQPDLRSLVLLFAVWYTNLMIHLVLDPQYRSKGLPLLSVPFSLTCLIFGPLIRAQASYQVASSTIADLWQPIWLQSVLKMSLGSFFWDQVCQSLGSVIFLPYTVTGAGILLMILIYSRYLFLGVVGSLALSYGIHGFMYPANAAGIMPLGYWNWSHFNFALIGAAAGGAFFVPSYGSLTAFLSCFWGCLISYYGFLYLFQYNIEAIHAFPLCFGTVIGVYLAQLYAPQSLNQGMVQPLERAMDLLSLKKKRFGEVPCQIELPILERCKILQGFSGPWTHQGKWRHAIDFICEDGSGKSYKNQGELPSDYLIYGQTVVSPVAGWVVHIEDLWEDSAIGKISFRGNWGNWILIRSPLGFHVMLAHLKKGSFSVKVGDYVEVGKSLAQVGNSGYSPEPHLHLQVQIGADLQTGTIPFLFKSYAEGSGLLRFNSIPKEGDTLLPLRIHQTLQWALNFKAGQELKFETLGASFKLRSGLDPKTGYWYFEEENAPGRAYFWKDEREFYFFDWKKVANNSRLNFFSLVLCRIPFTLGDNLHWVDHQLTERIPDRLVSAIRRLLISGLPWSSELKFTETSYHMSSDGTRISGALSSRSQNRIPFQIQLDPWVGIQSIQMGEEVWTRQVQAGPKDKAETLVDTTQKMALQV